MSTGLIMIILNLFLRSMREMQKQNKATTGHVHALIYILNVGVYHIEP